MIAGNTQSILRALQENVCAIWAVLYHVRANTITSLFTHMAPTRRSSISTCGSESTTPSSLTLFDQDSTTRPLLLASHNRSIFQVRSAFILQDIVGEVLAQGVWITHARCLHEQKLIEALMSIGLAIAQAVQAYGDRSCVMLPHSSPYRAPTPVDHIYYGEYSCG